MDLLPQARKFGVALDPKIRALITAVETDPHGDKTYFILSKPAMRLTVHESGPVLECLTLDECQSRGRGCCFKHPSIEAAIIAINNSLRRQD